MKTSDAPPMLKPYVFHGLDLIIGSGGQALGTCPFCSRDGKFSVSVDTGLWRCFVCGGGTDSGGGNSYTFLKLLWENSGSDLSDLVVERGLMGTAAAEEWGFRKSMLTGDWVMPGFGVDGKLKQLYKWAKDYKTGRHVLMSTPGHRHQLLGMNLFDNKKQAVYIAEGPWDGVALYETMRQAKVRDDGKLTLTGIASASLLNDANVVAVPGCGLFKEEWTACLADKEVTLLFDSDYPRNINGKTLLAGFDGMRRSAGIMARSEQPPREIRIIKWGPSGYDPTKKDGYDLRDLLAGEHKANQVSRRVGLLDDLLRKIEPIPADWIPGRTAEARKTGGTTIDCVECRDWGVLQMAWRKAMKWTEGLDRALSVMLASIVSVKSVGDQLWVKVIGPAACGKSTLCEALSVNKKYVKATSTLRGFHSGYRETSDDKEDNSLISLLYDKTLVTKDGDTLLQAPNMGQILSEARDIYDRTSRTHYRNKASKDYNGVNMTWILCGTSSLRSIDQSELGERFLDCVIMEGIDPELEDEILWRVANSAERGVGMEANGDISTQHDPSLVAAMQLTGGYIDYLRSNAQDLLSAVHADEVALRKCMALGKFVAYMRARPSQHQDETAERELASRLVSQLVRLSKCVAVVIGAKSLDDEVMRRVARVAMDTARGQTMELARVLAKEDRKGLTVDSVTMLANNTPEKTRSLLRFLKRIGAAEVFTEKKNNVTTRPRWRLTSRLQRLYSEVVK